MSARTGPLTAQLRWPGLWALPIPKVVCQGSGFNAVELTRDGISDLPPPLNRATCWVYCREAWPHVDPDFEGHIFITLAVQGDHRYSQLLANHKTTVTSVFPGQLFTTDPLSLHWLAPNSDSSPEFIGLQFEVPYDELNSFWGELLEQLGALGDMQSSEPVFEAALLLATADYIGTPPGPLA